MRMGIKELKLLWNTIVEIATGYKICQDRASEKFFSDVRGQYDDKLGFESTLQEMKSEIQKNEQMQLKLGLATGMLNSIIILAIRSNPKCVKLH
jgi:hypothetical protein